MELSFTHVALKILAVIALVLLNGFFVMAEFALVKVRETQLEPLIGRGHRRARAVRQVLGSLDRYLSAAQVGITVASLALGWVGEPVFAALLGPVMDGLGIESEHARHTIAFLVGFSALTFLHITAGEQAPKWLAIQKPLPAALWVAYPLIGFCRMAYPFIWAINQTSLWLLRRLGIQPASEAEMVQSAEELRLMFTATQKRLGGTVLGREIVLNALDLHQRVVLEVMRPRQEIAVLDTEASLTECLEIAEKTRFSRFPLCEGGDLDRTLGVVHLKDLFAMRFRAKSGRDLSGVMKRLIYVPETARLERVLQTLLERRLHLAMVVDEYGGTVGLITLENILEELVGQIQDEFDTEKPMLVQLAPDTWEVLGSLPAHHLAELVGSPCDVEGISTVSGWVTRQLGGFPKAGDVLLRPEFELRVEEMDGPRVARLRLRRGAGPAAAGGGSRDAAPGR
ncbi:MAG: HlyC/CorC family transporter [Verrucomicrobia bacterium]|nr:HlyC/CorC family transporter [Verrucomicrobiota bacterium]